MFDQMTAVEPMLDHIILPPFDPPSFAFNDQPTPKPTSPAEFFALHFPEAIKRFGSAVLERRRAFGDGSLKITPVSVNEDALASILGSNQCGDTIWVNAEMQFYQKDHRSGFFNPVEIEDLKLVLSQLFLKCITAMPRSVDVQPLFDEFRSDDVLNRIVQRSKAVLGVDESFFNPSGPNARNPITSPKETIRVFVDQCLVEDAAAVLTVKEAFGAYTAFCKAQQLPSLHINQFKVSAAPHIQRRFAKGVRNDLDRYGGDRCLGWRGLKLRFSANLVLPVET